MKSFEDIIEMILNKTIKVDEMISVKYDLEEVAKAFADLEKNHLKWYKILIRP
jgi:threonine dehydrogenase-like Zn-dependent dehydrogenase